MPANPACPDCGAPLEAGQARCRRCTWPAASASISAGPAQFQFSIQEILSLTATIAICLGALRAGPGFAMFLLATLAVSFVPAVMRARARAIGEPERGDVSRLGNYDLANAFAVDATAIIVGLLVFGVTALVAFFATCGNLHDRALFGRPISALAGMMVFCGSPAIGLVAAWLVYWRTSRQRRLFR
jgi:hypothetical protein